MKRILIVDDDKDLLFGLTSLLINKGYKVRTLEQGQLVLQEIKAFHPDLILLDVHLKDTNGREICQMLKQNFTTRNIPVILISGDKEKPDNGDTSGADLFLQKPFSLRILYAKLESLIMN